ncbi:aldehyde dehydrogenase family protein [Streptomyces sp. NPDC093088]|uniref:aldehyde dehydrogenase family protein n=1 Tax=Streptomyces sp. NPDC093088 TaxID=3366023 RepID=UPI0038053116
MHASSLVDSPGAALSSALVPPTDGPCVEVVDASTGRIFHRVTEYGTKEVDDLIASVAGAAHRWRALAVFARTEALLRWARELTDRREELAEFVARETGALRAEAALDVDRAVDCIRYCAGLVGKVDGRVLAGVPGHFGHTVREPYGVVGGVAARNSALSTFAWQAAPALAAGNGFVLHAHAEAPLGPLLAARLAEASGIDALAAFTGPESLSTHLAGHRSVGMLVYAGPADTGRKVIRASAGPIAPLTLNLASGNSAFVLPSADLAAAVPSVLHSRFSCAGQNWFGVSHVYVHVSLYEEFVTRAAALARRITVGPALDPGALMGPLPSETACERLAEAVAKGVSEGAEVHAGGRRVPGLEGGGYYEPTVVTDAGPANPLRTEPVAGPVLTVSPYTDADAAAAEANATRSGGIAQVWGRDAGAVKELADRLDVGTVWINTHDALSPEIATTAWRESGHGTAGGPDALDACTRTKMIMWDVTPLAGRIPAFTKIATRTDSEGSRNA